MESEDGCIYLEEIEDEDGSYSVALVVVHEIEDSFLGGIILRLVPESGLLIDVVFAGDQHHNSQH